MGMYNDVCEYTYIIITMSHSSVYVISLNLLLQAE